MKAMILAAGFGTRMRPLTDHTPKPLLKAGGKALIVHTIERLAKAGFSELIINTAHLGEQIEAELGTGQAWQVSIRYSREGSPLETGGAIKRALPLLGEQPFLLVNGDIYCDYPYEKLRSIAPDFAHLVLVKNPEFKSRGDFALNQHRLQLLAESAAPNAGFTYSGIGVYQPRPFASESQPDSFALGPWLREKAAAGQLSGELYSGQWFDIGTPERLKDLDLALNSSLLSRQKQQSQES